MAGVAAAVTNNDAQIAGASWNAKFMGLNASCADQIVLCYTTQGIIYAAMNGADIINASFATSAPSVTQELAIQAALEEGTLVVAGSGNDGRNNDLEPMYPASYPTVLSVGGIEKESDRNVFNYGQSVNVFAPSQRVESTTPPSSVGTGTGTSFGAPLVSGLAALVKTAFPHFTPDQVREQIRTTAVSIDTVNPNLSGKLGSGRIDAHKAVTAPSLPAVRVVEWSVANQDGSPRLASGDQVEVRVKFKNFHGAGADLSAQLVADVSFLQWSDQQVNLGSMATGDTRSVTFRFSIDSDTPTDSRVFLTPLITGASYSDRADLLRIAINEPGIATHATPALTVTVTAEGNIGHTTFQGASGSHGKGFVVTKSDGSQRDLLFEGGLMVATAPTHISDCVRQSETDLATHEEDWVAVSALQILKPGNYTAEQGTVVIKDSGASSPIGVDVLQESFMDDAGANEDFIIFRYTVTNTGASRIESMHLGLFLDWNVTTGAQDATGFDATRSVGYVSDSGTSPTMLVGTRLLTGQALHYSAVDNAATIDRSDSDGFTPDEKWGLLTGGVRNHGVVNGAPRDVSQLTAAGPMILEPGASEAVAFALISGTSLPDFPGKRR